MTYNEFKMCCVLFCKTFEGKKYGEVVKECYRVDSYSVVTKFPLFDNVYFVLEDKCVMWWIDNEGLKIPLLTTSLYFEKPKDFLNYFKIPLEDIV